jgi:hypothetical protein
MNQAKHFLRTIIIALISMILVYIMFFYYFAHTNASISHSYKQFLLQYTQGKRLIIDSGSNSFHGINSKMMEKEFGLLTINLADNAGYPLKNKLLRIEEYSHSGDILLLPLELDYYVYNKIPSIFSNNLLGLLNYYYYNSFFEELFNIWRSPFSTLINSIKYKKRLLKKKKKYLKQHINQFNLGFRGDYFLQHEPPTPPADPATEQLTCDQYILAKSIRHKQLISPIFKENIHIIKRLKTKGIHVFFTWPVVVGNNCYSKKYQKGLNLFISRIKQYLNDNELFIVGDPYANKFPTKDMLNTYYHVIHETRDIHTKKLILDIKTSKAYPWFQQVNREEHKLTISL